MMREQIDPKELKTLSDILALVLDDQPGQAANALEAARARARRNHVTAGALKNLFVSIAPNPPAPKASRPRAPRAATGSAATGATELQASRARISHLTAEMNRLDLDLRGAYSQVQALQSELTQTRKARAEAQQALMATQATAPKWVMLLMAALFGLLIGAAATGGIMVMARNHGPETSHYLQ